mmetsp:Transcript_66998/g.187276  ORF Transcript_66998/g.187276 Transcript_66998/m.187276 type:complete len:221 (+) Transcript_66998:573-1235(+)
MAMPMPFWLSVKCSTRKRVREVDGSITAVQFQPMQPTFLTEVLCTKRSWGSLTLMEPIGGCLLTVCFLYACPSSANVTSGAATCSKALTYKSFGTISPARGRTSLTSCWPVIWAYLMLPKSLAACFSSGLASSACFVLCLYQRTRALKRSTSSIRASSESRSFCKTATSSCRKPSVRITCCACFKMKDKYLSCTASCWYVRAEANTMHAVSGDIESCKCW